MNSRPVWPTYWVPVQPGIFHLSWTINPGYKNTDSCVCSQLLKLARVTLLCQALCLPWALCSSSFFHCVVSEPLILSYPGWWFPHVTITDTFILFKLIPPTSSDTNPHQHATQWLFPSFLCGVHVSGMCMWVVCACRNPRQMAESSSLLVHLIQGLKKKNSEFANMTLGIPCFCLLRTTTYTRPLCRFLGMLA